MGAVTSAKSNGTRTFEKPAPGVYPARCVQTVELGRHPNRFYNPEKDHPDNAFRQELLIVWELSELMQDGRPFVVSWRDRNAISEKSNLNKLLTAWRGRPFTKAELLRFELRNILDVCCFLNLVESPPDRNGNVWINVESAIPLPRGVACEPRHNDLIDFSIADIDTPLFKALWPWVQKIIQGSQEYQSIVAPSVPVQGMADEVVDDMSVPF